jgi:hypothetical protein
MVGLARRPGLYGVDEQRGLATGGMIAEVVIVGEFGLTQSRDIRVYSEIEP